MKTFIASLLLCSTFAAATAGTPAGYLKDFDYQLTDIATKGLKKEKLFDNMETSFLDLQNSICANRAHMWGYDLTKDYRINTGKIFIFFGSSIWTDKDKHGYWYHVAPYIIENGKEFVMEASYPAELQAPVTVKEWVESETYSRVNGNDCVELTGADLDMSEHMLTKGNLPEKRKNGKPGARCYIRKVPGHYWFPGNIALHDLKRDREGNKINYDPKAFDKEDVIYACTEASTSRFARAFGGGKAKCRAHVNRIKR